MLLLYVKKEFHIRLTFFFYAFGKSPHFTFINYEIHAVTNLEWEDRYVMTKLRVTPVLSAVLTVSSRRH